MDSRIPFGAHRAVAVSPSLFGLRFLGLLGVGRAHGLPRAHHQAQHQRARHGADGGKRQLVPPNQFLKPIRRARWTGEDGFVIEVSLDVARQPVGRVVTARAVLFQALHHDPVEVALKFVHELTHVSLAAFARRGAGFASQCIQLGRRA